ncbi:MAG: class I SAM-dependent methyltransferase [Crenarchaeota archaeon]|nr:class I SAM-dependent methyltransferase [Thermoproteota archaeon]
MHISFWNVLRDPYTGEDLAFEGVVEDERWIEGVLKSRSGASYRVIDGVAVFVREGVDTGWSDEDIEELKRGNWIRRNWEDHMSKIGKGGLWDRFCREIAEHGGLILDVASGPGGGFVPCVLYYNDGAYVAMNDIEYRILLMWRRFLKSVGKGRNVSFIAADARRLPLRDCSLDVVTSAGGFGNIDRNDVALREAFRVLKPGGAVYMAEGGILREDFEKLPAEVQRKWLERSPALLGEWDRILRSVGFKIVLYQRVGVGTISPDESELGREAYRYGVTLRYVGYYIKALKPFE